MNLTSLEISILLSSGSHTLYAFDSELYPTKMPLFDLASSFSLPGVLFMTNTSFPKGLKLDTSGGLPNLIGGFTLKFPGRRSVADEVR